MSDLLPPNATDLEHAVADVCARIDEVPIIIRELWNPQTCPADLLPWLAWSFSVDDWDSSWSDQQKRDTIAAAIEVQQIKGTIGSVRSALAALGIDARVQEWFNQIPEGSPYTYKLLLEAYQTPVTQDGLAKVLQLIDTNKSLRSHMSVAEVSARSESPVYAGAASMVGSEIGVHFVPAMALPNAYVIAMPPPIAFPNEITFPVI